MRSNCIHYVIVKAWNEGGGIIVRRSQFAGMYGITNNWHPARWVPHFLHYSKDKKITQFTPTSEQKAKDIERGVVATLLLRLVTLWYYEGEVTND